MWRRNRMYRGTANSKLALPLKKACETQTPTAYGARGSIFLLCCLYTSSARRSNVGDPVGCCVDSSGNPNKASQACRSVRQVQGGGGEGLPSGMRTWACGAIAPSCHDWLSSTMISQRRGMYSLSYMRMDRRNSSTINPAAETGDASREEDAKKKSKKGKKAKSVDPVLMDEDATPVASSASTNSKNNRVASDGKQRRKSKDHPGRGSAGAQKPKEAGKGSLQEKKRKATPGSVNTAIDPLGSSGEGTNKEDDVPETVHLQMVQVLEEWQRLTRSDHFGKVPAQVSAAPSNSTSERERRDLGQLRSELATVNVGTYTGALMRLFASVQRKSADGGSSQGVRVSATQDGGATGAHADQPRGPYLQLIVLLTQHANATDGVSPLSSPSTGHDMSATSSNPNLNDSVPRIALDVSPILESRWNVMSTMEFVKCLQFLPTDKQGRRVPYEAFVEALTTSLANWIDDRKSASSLYPNAALLSALLLASTTQYGAMVAPKAPAKLSKKTQHDAPRQDETGTSSPDVKKKRTPIKHAYLRGWVENMLAEIAARIVNPLLSSLDGAMRTGNTEAVSRSVADKTALAVALLTFATDENAAVLSRSNGSCTPEVLRSNAEFAVKSVTETVKRLEGELPTAFDTVDDCLDEALAVCRTSLCDVLDALISQSRCATGCGVSRDLGRSSELIQTYVDRVQQLAANHPLVLFRVWCDRTVAIRVESVPQGELLKHVRNAVFASASLVADNEQCESTVLAETRQLQPGDMKSDPSHLMLVRPRIALALMAAGYDPEPILSSGFCVSFSPRELMDTLSILTHFCPQVAMRPLPSRVQTTLAAAVSTSLQQCIRNNSTSFRSKRLCEMFGVDEQVPHELLPATFTTCSGMESSADASLVVHGNTIAMLLNIWQREDGESRSASAEVSDALSTLFLSMNYVVEMTVRGDSKGLTAMLPSLLAVLEQGGGVAFMNDGHEWILHGIIHRLRTIETAEGAGAASALRDQGGQSAPSTSISTFETALTTFNSHFVQRFAEAAQRQLSKLKRVQVRDTMEQLGTLNLHRRTMRLCVRVCGTGMNASQARQLTGLASAMEVMLSDLAPEKYHNKLGNVAPVKDIQAEDASGVVAIREWRRGIPREMLAFLSAVETLRSCVATFHSADSVGMRSANTLAVDMVSVHLCTLRGKLVAATEEGQTSIDEDNRAENETGEPPLSLQVVSIVYTMLTRYGAEHEPAELRRLRADALDPALTRLLSRATHAAAGSETGGFPPAHSVNGVDGSTSASSSVATRSYLTPATFAEIATVVCVLRTIHHVSIEFYKTFTDALCMCMETFQNPSDKKKRKHISQTLRQLLVASAPVCLLGDSEFMHQFHRQTSAVSPFLMAPDMIKVLCTINDLSIPVTGPIEAVIERLRDDAASVKSPLRLVERVAALRELSRAADQDDTPTDAYNETTLMILRQVALERGQFTVGDVGVIAGVVAQLYPSLSHSLAPRKALSAVEGSNEPPGLTTDASALLNLPTELYDLVIESRHTALPEQVTAILRGYSALPSVGECADIKKKVMNGFILQTITVAPRLTPLQLVECLESYLHAHTSHEYLFGVLLARVGDVRQKFTLPLAVRLVQCCAKAKYDPNVQRACQTAAHPVFIGIVRGRLKNDPVSLAAVGSNAVTVLRSLKEVFPHDPVNDAVLHNIALYIDRMPTTAIIAALRLIEAKGSLDYGVMRSIVSHTVEHVLPHASPRELSELSLLLVRCGARSPVLLKATAQRFGETRNEFDGESLGMMCRTFVEANAENLNAVADIVTDVVGLLESAGEDKILGTGKKIKAKENSNEKINGTLEHHELKSSNACSDPRSNIRRSASPADIVSTIELLNMADSTEVSRHVQELLLGHLTDTVQRTQRHASESDNGAASVDDKKKYRYQSSTTQHAQSVGPDEPMLSASQINIILSACVQHNLRCDSKSYTLFEAQLTQHVQRNEPWHADLFLVVKLAQSVVALRERYATSSKSTSSQETLLDSKVLVKLFDIIFDRRSNLMKRQQLLKPVTGMMHKCGPSVHGPLYSLLTESEMEL